MPGRPSPSPTVRFFSGRFSAKRTYAQLRSSVPHTDALVRLEPLAGQSWQQLTWFSPRAVGNPHALGQKPLTFNRSVRQRAARPAPHTRGTARVST